MYGHQYYRAGRSRDALVVAPRPASSVANYGTGQLVPEVRTAAGRTAGGLTTCNMALPLIRAMDPNQSSRSGVCHGGPWEG